MCAAGQLDLVGGHGGGECAAGRGGGGKEGWCRKGTGRRIGSVRRVWCWLQGVAGWGMGEGLGERVIERVGGVDVEGFDRYHPHGEGAECTVWDRAPGCQISMTAQSMHKGRIQKILFRVLQSICDP